MQGSLLCGGMLARHTSPNEEPCGFAGFGIRVKPVWPVQHVEIDVICLQPLKTTVYRLHNVAPIQGEGTASDVRHLARRACGFGSNDVVLSARISEQ